MDYKWNFAFMSIGCLFIMIAPMQENQWPLIILGMLIVLISGGLFYRQMKKDKKEG